MSDEVRAYWLRPSFEMLNCVKKVKKDYWPKVKKANPPLHESEPTKAEG